MQQKTIAKKKKQMFGYKTAQRHVTQCIQENDEVIMIKLNRHQQKRNRHTRTARYLLTQEHGWLSVDRNTTKKNNFCNFFASIDFAGIGTENGGSEKKQSKCFHGF